MTYLNLTDEEILKLQDAVDNTLANMKSDIRKAKLKVFGKSLLSLVIVAGGVALLHFHHLSLLPLLVERPR